MFGGIKKDSLRRRVGALAVAAVALSSFATPVAAHHSGDVNCADFATWEAARDWFWVHFVTLGDVANLDANDDGYPCESLPSAPATDGYWMLTANGRIFAFGTARAVVPDQQVPLNGGETAVQLVANPSGTGAWLLTSEGRVIALGGAPDYGNVDTSGFLPNERTSTMAATPGGLGLFVFTNRGRAVVLGNATHFGDLVTLGVEPGLAGDIVDSAPLPDGTGYFMVGTDGGIFAFGAAVFVGSVPQVVSGPLNSPVNGLVIDPDGTGYWLVAGDGGVFAFSADFVGSVPAVLAPGVVLAAPVTGMVPYGTGYLMVATDGGVFTFSNLAFLGSLGGVNVGSPVVAIAPLA